MEGALRIISLVAEGAKSNWWGIGCPSHCGGLSLPLGLSLTLIGFLLGSLCTIILLIWLGLLHLWTSSPPGLATSSEPRPVSSRLQAYLNESNRVSSLRRRERHQLDL